MTTSFKSDKPVSEPEIQAVCLLPEFPPLTGGADDEGERMERITRENYEKFAQRFHHAFYITTRYGLKQVGFSFEPSPKKYGDMHPEERHTFLLHLGKQLAAFSTRGVPFIVLAGGLLTQGLRRLELPLVLPLASMSPAMRRRWLVARNKETNMQIWEAIFAPRGFAPGELARTNGKAAPV